MENEAEAKKENKVEMKQERVDEFSHLAEKVVLDMLEKGYIPAEVEKLTSLECDKGDMLVFQLREKLPHKIRDNLIKNFDQWLQHRGIAGIYMPPDIDFIAVLKKPAYEVKRNVQIEEPKTKEG